MRPRHLIFLFIFLIGAFLRIYSLGEKNLWVDEACSTFIASKCAPDLIREVRNTDAHPPLFNLTLHCWILFFGSSERALRSLPALFSIISLPMFYALSRRIFSHETAILSLFFFSVSAFQIFYAQEVRLYSLAVLLSISLSYVSVRIAEAQVDVEPKKEARNPGWILWLSFVIISILGLYTQVYFLFVILALDLWLISIFKNGKSPLLKLGISNLITFLAFLPWIPVTVARVRTIASLHTSLGKSTPGILETFLPGFVSINVGFLPMSNLLTFYTFLVFFVSLTVMAFVHFSNSRRILTFFLFTILLPLIFTTAQPKRVHIFEAKHIIVIAPFLFLAFAEVIRRVNSRLIRMALAGFIIAPNLASLIIYYHPEFKKENWSWAANLIKKEGMIGDIVLIDPGYAGFAFDYYYTRGGPTATAREDLFPPQSPQAPIEIPRCGVSGDFGVRDLNVLLTAIRVKRIFLVQNLSPVACPGGEVREFLEKNLKMVIEKSDRGVSGKISVTLYSKPVQDRFGGAASTVDPFAEWVPRRSTPLPASPKIKIQKRQGAKIGKYHH